MGGVFSVTPRPDRLGCLDCAREVKQTREIVASGTSAEHQLTILAELQKTGIAPRHAIIRVVD
jgi:hypothetical protein